jgi:hypothetical protein
VGAPGRCRHAPPLPSPACDPTHERHHGGADYADLLDTLDRSTIAHDVLLTVTVDLVESISRRGTSTVAAALVCSFR